VRTIIEPGLASITGSTGPFSGPQLGVGLLLAGLVLFVMVLPTMVAISRDVIAAVPSEQVEGALALGATRWQVLWRVVVPSARTGLLGAITLSTGRALGETIAVTMVIGNSTTIANSLFSPAATLASAIANQFTEATEPYHLSSLMALAVILMAIAVIVNVAARLLVGSIGRQRSATAVAVA
jgi:phosphate transport system permease protein